MNKCKICDSDLKKVFNKKILKKYDVFYFQCVDCGFLQTENPHWLEESYSSAITSLDIGLVSRNIHFSNVVEEILYKFFDKNAKFLDFGGGYGMFTRIMRDKGFDFFHEDKYCENLFAKHFTIDDLKTEDKKFELVTSFELMEHVENPFEKLDYIFSISKSFLFSTEIIPNSNIEDWWYLGTEHGQHISFYTKKSLEKIAEKYGKNYYSDGSLHLITDKNNLDIFKFPKIGKLKKFLLKFLNKNNSLKNKLSSKTWSDFEYVRDNFCK